MSNQRRKSAGNKTKNNIETNFCRKSAKHNNGRQKMGEKADNQKANRKQTTSKQKANRNQSPSPSKGGPANYLRSSFRSLRNSIRHTPRKPTEAQRKERGRKSTRIQT